MTKIFPHEAIAGFLRGLWIAIVSAGGVFFTAMITYRATEGDVDWLSVISVTGAAFFGALAMRVREGYMDARRPTEATLSDTELEVVRRLRTGRMSLPPDYDGP